MARTEGIGKKIVLLIVCLLAVAGCQAPGTAAPPAPCHLGQGLMAAEALPDSVVLQARLTRSAELIDGDLPGCPGVGRFEIADNAAFADARSSEWLQAHEPGDFILRTRVGGLAPDTRYHYRLHYGLDREHLAVSPAATVRTPAGADRAASYKIAVVTGMNYAPFQEAARGGKSERAEDLGLGYPALDSIGRLGCDFFVGTGDNIYYDRPAGVQAARTLAQMRRKWHEQFAQPRFRRLFAALGTYWEKDDHDFRYDDCDLTGTQAPSAELGRRVFLEQLPQGDPGDRNPTTYRTVRVSRDLQIWLTEGRDFRSPNAEPDGPDKWLWGKTQRQWLQRTLLASDAAFKVLISPTPLVGPDRASKKDNHTNPQGFRHERDNFIGWLKENGLIAPPGQGHAPPPVGRFLVVCGDRHWRYHAVDPSGLEEFSCGALTNSNSIVGDFPGQPGSTDPAGRIRQPYHPARACGGFLVFAIQPPRPSGGPATASAAPGQANLDKDPRPRLTVTFYDALGQQEYSVER